MRYAELNQTLKGRNKQGKKYANNTYLHRRGDNIALQYHSTDVATFTPNGDIILNSGGWCTSTTKERISWALANTEFSITQELGVWYIIQHKDNNNYWSKDNPRWRYADNMTVNVNTHFVSGFAPNTPKVSKAD